ncbi:GntR family transcriptional regulator [Paenarthrobacter sp. YAF11_1]|uniref:GntR family transcriptional regulator n=1 Tax=Paenarthrobacter sp. YAF11_1 TaxID=3233074 RepID=UPI003F96D140
MTTDAVRRTAAPLRQEVVNALRHDIVAQEFRPGERLVESMLCERYSVSRTVVREALRQLESEGLVRMIANRGPEVATLSIREAQSLYEVRRALESLAGSLFAERATGVQCTELVARFSAIKSAMASGDPVKRLEAKDRYYDALFEGAGNPEIARMLRSVHARTQMLRNLSLATPGRAVRTVAEIARITAASAVIRDPEDARIACEEHVTAAAHAALTAMRRLENGN